MYIYLHSLFVGLLILSNILGVKLISVGNFILPAAVIAYVVTYLITDVIGEVYGKDAARKTVQAGFLTQVIGLVFIYLAIELPAAPIFANQEAFATILGGSFRVMLASLLAYLVSQNVDVIIFHRLKEKHGEKKLWLRNNLSTMLSQLLDTTIFIAIAFAGTVPTPVLISMIVTQYVVKFMIAIIDTPIAYLLVKLAKKEKVNGQQLGQA
ncbi:queuosine precursor transporter [Aquibacillus salsiterrae]|uniref:Probable queuosine precursor transporter n=1 Tax=Aquibacillus salsiterrae TaxID=2950439 RepID=A0A9X3WDT3_9BACI|nr:queuosine precursor transporter [Aquibacillus salsiterrae]MDC3416883.1 queuosine precursor transporter [Aquibacillus salsiterrae]